ncbi:MAG: DegV family protein [Chloroflexi bacterium]|nr:DegV family protein [Chloroflexota bacterium]
MTHKIGLITDSTCDIPQELIATYRILRMPQYVVWGEDEYNDLIDIDPPTFYRRLPEDPLHPTTSRPTVPDIMKLVDKAKQEGAEEIVIIVVSDKLSGSYDASLQAQQEIDIPSYVIDSMSVSMGLGWQVLAAARAREDGASAEEMIQTAAQVRERTQVVFTVDTLEFLHRGGRIGGAAKWIGTALQLKPSLYVDHSLGEVAAGQRIRTRKKAIRSMIESFFGGYRDDKPQHVSVAHGGSPEDAIELAQTIKGRFAPEELYITHVSPAIGVHAGPGVLSIAGY